MQPSRRWWNLCESDAPRFLLALSLCLASAQAQERPEGFYLTSPLSLSYGYDQGFVARTGKLNDTVGLLTGPTFAWMHTTHRQEFFVDYRPEVELFRHNSELNSWNHLAAMRYKYRINGRWSVDTGNLFLSTADASRQLVNSLLLLPRGRFLQNSAYLGAGYRVNSRTKIDLRLDNTFTNTDLPGALAGRLDGVTTAATLTVDHKVTSRQKLSVSYSFLHSHPLRLVAGGASNVNLTNAGYAIEVNPGLILQLGAGVVRGGQTSFIGTAVVEKRLGGMWVAGGYQRYLSFFGGLPQVSGAAPGSAGFADGSTPGFVYQVASVRARGRLSPRIGLEAGLQRVLNGKDRQFQSISGIISQLHLSYRLTDRVTWFVRLEHYGQTANLFVAESLSRSRYFAGVELSLSRPPAPDKPSDRRAIEQQGPVAAGDALPGEKL